MTVIFECLSNIESKSDTVLTFFSNKYEKKGT